MTQDMPVGEGAVVMPRGEHMSGTLGPWRLFASSYMPLFALLALRFDRPWLRIALGALAAVTLVDTIRIAVWVPRRVGASPYLVDTVEDRGDQVAGYLATYLLPFLVVPDPSATDLAAYALFLAVAAVISVRSHLTHINPTLYLLRYRLVNITTVEGFEGAAVIRSALKQGSTLRAVHLDRRVLVEVRP
jgi:hypothetical protein